jgi:hypothetical protein
MQISMAILEKHTEAPQKGKKYNYHVTQQYGCTA